MQAMDGECMMRTKKEILNTYLIRCERERNERPREAHKTGHIPVIVTVRDDCAYCNKRKYKQQLQRLSDTIEQPD